MACRTANSEAGFTLAGLVVIMTVIAVMIAYTIPRQWSIAVARDRDQQTLFAMRQYARAIKNFQASKNNPAKALPTSLDQLKQARSPRLIRGKGEFLDPLTGKADWIMVPASAQQPNQPGVPVGSGVSGIDPPRSNTPPPQQTGLPGQPQQPQSGQPGGFVGPFIGVRPGKTGTSYLMLNGHDSYEQWMYTVNDLNNEILQQQNALNVK